MRNVNTTLTLVQMQPDMSFANEAEIVACKNNTVQDSSWNDRRNVFDKDTYLPIMAWTSSRKAELKRIPGVEKQSWSWTCWWRTGQTTHHCEWDMWHRVVQVHPLQRGAYPGQMSPAHPSSAGRNTHPPGGNPYTRVWKHAFPRGWNISHQEELYLPGYLYYQEPCHCPIAVDGRMTASTTLDHTVKPLMIQMVQLPTLSSYAQEPHSALVQKATCRDYTTFLLLTWKQWWNEENSLNSLYWTVSSKESKLGGKRGRQSVGSYHSNVHMMTKNTCQT